MRYLASGYYGEGNLGDEAILAGILQEIRAHDPHAAFTVLSFDPTDTERRHGVEAVPTSLRRPAKMLSAIREADLVISGGGSFLHEADFEVHGRSFLWREGKLRPIPYFLSVVLLARSVGRPVMWYAQGLGPLHTVEARRAVAAAASGCPAVTWRDPDSARLAAEVGVRAPIQLVVADPAYALAPASPERVSETLEASGLDPGARFIAVCPRPWLRHAVFVERLGDAVGRFADNLDCAVVLVPFQERLDAAVCEAIAQRPGLTGRARVLRGVEAPAIVSGVLGCAELAITMRLHGGILAAAAGTPAAVVDYDPKVRAFARQTGQERSTLTVDDLERPDGADRLDTMLRAVYEQRALRRAALERRVHELRRDASGTARLAVQVAAAGGVPDPRTVGGDAWSRLTGENSTTGDGPVAGGSLSE